MNEKYDSLQEKTSTLISNITTEYYKINRAKKISKKDCDINADKIVK